MKLMGMQDKVDAILGALDRRHPVLLYGPTGSGKTMIAWEAACRYIRGRDLSIIYLQLYPEMTKNSLIGGETIQDGSIVVKEQPILTLGASKKGALFIIDECTHTTEPVLLAFNSLIEEPYTTVVGSEVYTLNGNTRFLFCGNPPDHVGNIHLPISFANRLFMVKTQLPDGAVLNDIGKQVSAELGREIPDTLIRFAVNIIEKVHEPSFPVSPRNLILCMRSIGTLIGKGYDCNRNEAAPSEIRGVCKKHKISEMALKETILSTMMAHTVCKSQGPEKVAALLW